VTDDFLRRTAERALGQARVVTPVLASTYQPGAGFRLESELTLATPWLTPSSRDTTAHLSVPARASAPDSRQPRPSPRESRVEVPETVETGPPAAAPHPGPSPSVQVEQPVDDPEPTLSPLAREQPPARHPSVPPAPTRAVPSPVERPPLPTAEPAPTLGPVEELRSASESVPTPAEPPVSIAEPTLSALDELQPEAFGRDAAAAEPTPVFAASQPRETITRPPGRRRADRSEPPAGPQTEWPEPTLDAAPAMQPTVSRKTVASEAPAARADSPVSLSPWSLPPTASRRLDSEPRRADDPDSQPVRVTIGRVEIRGDSPAPAPPAPPEPSRPALTLDEYLRTRGGIV
jgi:hypothetical protein